MYKEIDSNAGLITAAIVGAVLVITAMVWALDETQQEELAATDAGVKVEERTTGVKVVAPFTSVRKDSTGTHVRTPGVDIEAPPNPPD